MKVTFVKPDKEEKIFLSCLCPMPLEYANVHRGIPHRKYLEMDPKFAEGLGIGQDTEASVIALLVVAVVAVWLTWLITLDSLWKNLPTGGPGICT